MATRAARAGVRRPRRSALGHRVASARSVARGVRVSSRAAALPRSSGFVLLLAVVVVLDVVGLVMVLSSSSVQALRAYGSAWLFFERQLLWVGLGTIAMVVLSRVDYRTWARRAGPRVLIYGALRLAVLQPGGGISANGSTRWLGAGTWRIQPSELAKLALLVFTAALLTRREDEIDDPHRALWPVLVVSGVVGALVMVQPDMGTTLVSVCIVGSVLFAAGVPLAQLSATAMATAAGSVVLGLLEPYRRDRILAFLDPWADPANTGYQTIQGQVALAGGHLAGVGLGASRAKWGFLPNAHTDFIFAIIGEEAGLLGSLIVLALFAAFGVLGVRTALRAPDRFGTLLATGITAWVVGQALVNIGAVIGLLPITGVPLPYVSFGGSSLVLLMGAVGILLNVARQARPVGTPTSRAR
jgi:cell division protein FtsW